MRGTMSRAVDAHLRYLERDGVTRDGERGKAYSAFENEADSKAFVERGRGYRHQFRFIVAPEDSAEMADLRGFTRDLMRRMELDLGTRLDWIAIAARNRRSQPRVMPCHARAPARSSARSAKSTTAQIATSSRYPLEHIFA
jgi:type IV secretory pathway VirD2 relaxase